MIESKLIPRVRSLWCHQRPGKLTTALGLRPRAVVSFPGRWWHHNDLNLGINSYNHDSSHDQIRCFWLAEVRNFTNIMIELAPNHKRLAIIWHDDVIKWKHFPRYWPFVRGIHRSPVNSPHKGQWRGALMFSLICVWINGWVNNREAGDLGRYRPHYDVIVMNQRWPNSLTHTCASCIHLKRMRHFCQRYKRPPDIFALNQIMDDTGMWCDSGVSLK